MPLSSISVAFMVVVSTVLLNSSILVSELTLELSNTPAYPNLDVIRSPIVNNYLTGKNVKVALIDSGLHLGHPEFADTNIITWNVVDQNDNVYDACHHGTQVAGPLLEVAPDIDLLVIKVFTDHNCQSKFELIENAIYYAIDNGAKVINISISGAYVGDPLLEVAEYAYNHNVLIVASVGNGQSEELHYPAASAHVLAVSGTTNDDNDYYRNNIGEYLDVSAPGFRVWVPFYVPDTNEYTYNTFSGTSAAAPHVSGIAALLIQAKPDITVDELTDILKLSAKDVYTPGFDIVTGYGRVDAFNAMLVLTQRYDLYDEIDLHLVRLPIIQKNTKEAEWLNYYYGQQ